MDASWSSSCFVFHMQTKNKVKGGEVKELESIVGCNRFSVQRVFKQPVNCNRSHHKQDLSQLPTARPSSPSFHDQHIFHSGLSTPT